MGSLVNKKRTKRPGMLMKWLGSNTPTKSLCARCANCAVNHCRISMAITIAIGTRVIVLLSKLLVCGLVGGHNKPTTS